MSEEKTTGKTSRRNLMRLAGPAAAGAAALAATGALRPGAARAMPMNDGGAYTIGAQNHSTATTWLINDVGPGNDVVEILLNEANILPSTSPRSYISGLTARSDDGNVTLHGGIGVLGVFGQSEVNQLGKLLAGVYGLAFPSANNASIGVGVVAHSIGGAAPLWIVPQGTSGATGPGAMFPGAMWADAGGAIYNQRTGLGNNSLNANLYQLSSVNLLSAPYRLIDTRGGQPAPLPTTKAPLAPNTPTLFQVTGPIGSTGTHVPPGATAVICNLTVTNTAGAGDLIAYPGGTTKPLSSNLNYVGGQTIANFAIVGLSTAGTIDLYAHVSGTDVILDIAGYII